MIPPSRSFLDESFAAFACLSTPYFAIAMPAASFRKSEPAVDGSRPLCAATTPA